MLWIVFLSVNLLKRIFMKQYISLKYKPVVTVFRISENYKERKEEEKLFGDSLSLCFPRSRPNASIQVQAIYLSGDSRKYQLGNGEMQEGGKEASIVCY